MGRTQDRELLFSVRRHDFKVDTFRAGGKGGQHQNTTDSGVRITHIESGAVGEARDNRSQAQNKKEAFRRLRETVAWKKWFNLKVWEATNNISIQKKVDAMMKEIQLEYLEDGKWAVK